MKGDILEDPANEPKEDMYMMSVDPQEAPDQPEYVSMASSSLSLSQYIPLCVHHAHFPYNFLIELCIVIGT